MLELKWPSVEKVGAGGAESDIDAGFEIDTLWKPWSVILSVFSCFGKGLGQTS